MSAIYRTLTGNIECTMEGGVLFVRDYSPKRGKWREEARTPEEILAEWAEVKRPAPAKKYRLGCMAHCLLGQLDSSWLVEPLSSDLLSKARRLQAEYEAALEAERKDRPKTMVSK